MSIFHREKIHDRYQINAKQVVCTHCGGNTFHVSSCQLHTQGLTFFQLEWLGQSVYVLICDTCSHIEWFAKEPEKVPTA